MARNEVLCCFSVALSLLIQSFFNLAADVDLLLDFKKSMVKRDPFSVLASWTPSGRQDYCTLYGITCGRDASVTSVDSISITSCELEFTMWDGFAAFQRLRYINFSGNSISGSIPSQLGRLKSLVSLDLSSNRLAGSVPSTFSNLSLLEDLSLSQNMFSGMIPSSLGTLKGLSRCLDLSQNKFTGTVPMALGSMKWVKFIDLSDNMLSGILPPSLGGCESLTSLYLSHHLLSGSIPSTWINMASLYLELDLSYNDLSGNILAELGQISSLSTLDLSWNKLTGNIPRSLVDLENLQILNSSSNFLSGEIPDTTLFQSFGQSSFLGI